MAEPLRFPLYAPLTSRDVTTDKDSIASNVFYDAVESTMYAVKRPGIETLVTGSGQGQGIYFFDNYLFSWETNPYDWTSALFKGDSLLIAVNLITTAGGVTALSLQGRTWEVGEFNAPIFSGASYLMTDGTTYTVNSSNKFFQSSDGVNWTEVSTQNPGSSPAMTWGNGLYVVLSGSADFVTSTDAITWTARNDADVNGTNIGSCLVYGSGKFVGVKSLFGATTRGVYSTDGINWSESIMSASAQGSPPSSICFGNGKFVAVSSGSPSTSSTGYHSTDGITWTLTTLPATQAWRSVAWNGSVFIAVGNSATIAISSDGLTWRAGNIPFLSAFKLVVANPTTGVIMALSSLTPFGYARSSDNGVNWTLGNLPSADTTIGTITTL
jgi:hypothetical protein